jgi:hypothetical protein
MASEGFPRPLYMGLGRCLRLRHAKIGHAAALLKLILAYERGIDEFKEACGSINVSVAGFDQ